VDYVFEYVDYVFVVLLVNHDASGWVPNVRDATPLT
jgi:hypothetical protein